jgi:hypothetical protein
LPLAVVPINLHREPNLGKKKLGGFASWEVL